MNANIEKYKLKEICKKYDIIFMGVFGSYVHGDFTPKSDLDLLVRFSKQKGLLDLVRIEREISQYAGVKVDMLTEGSLSPYLKDSIISDLEVVYDAKG